MYKVNTAKTANSVGSVTLLVRTVIWQVLIFLCIELHFCWSQRLPSLAWIFQKRSYFVCRPLLGLNIIFSQLCQHDRFFVRPKHTYYTWHIGYSPALPPQFPPLEWENVSELHIHVQYASKKTFHTVVFNHRRYCVVQTVVWPLQDRCMTVVWPLHDRCVTVAWAWRNRLSTVPFQQSEYTNAVCSATQLSALHNYRERCSGIAYKRYCGIGTLYFKILTLVTAIIWQPGHWPQGYLHTSSD